VPRTKFGFAEDEELLDDRLEEEEDRLLEEELELTLCELLLLDEKEAPLSSASR